MRVGCPRFERDSLFALRDSTGVIAFEIIRSGQVHLNNRIMGIDLLSDSKMLERFFRISTCTQEYSGVKSVRAKETRVSPQRPFEMFDFLVKLPFIELDPSDHTVILSGIRIYFSNPF